MRADRLLAMMMLLQSHGKMTTSKLAQSLGVSRRTILRDIDALSGVGIPLYTEGGRSGGVALDENYKLALTGLKAAEVRTLFVSGLPHMLNDVGLEVNAENTLLQLFAALPSPHQQEVEALRQRIHIDPTWWGEAAQTPTFWLDLQRAVFEDLCLVVTYEYRGGEMVERVIEPYSLVMKAGTWYLVARRDGEFRTYRVSRLRTGKFNGQRFQRQPNFELGTYWQQHVQEMVDNYSRYSFTLRLTPAGVEYINAYSPTSADIETQPQPDGTYLARITMGTLESAKIMVFGLGERAVIVEPAELQEALIAGARDVLARVG